MEASDSDKPPQYDKFFTPQNDHFYSNVRYDPLDKRFNEIRLLQIDTSDLRAHRLIQKVPIDRASSYSALSYYSGSDSNTTVKINVEGIPFNAFANTAQAIEDTIHCWNGNFAGEVLLLWIDQICINQSDPAEKAHQVEYMREIYIRADRVFLSMPVKRSVSPALKWLRSKADRRSNGVGGGSYQISQPAHVVEMRYMPQGSDEGYKSSRNKAHGDNHDTEDNSPAAWAEPTATWDMMYDIIEHPWWSRAWVHQEFIMASRTFFLFSFEVWIDWGEFHPLLHMFLSMSVQDHLTACGRYCESSEKNNRRKHRYRKFLEPCSDEYYGSSAVLDMIYGCLVCIRSEPDLECLHSRHHDCCQSCCEYTIHYFLRLFFVGVVYSVCLPIAVTLHFISSTVLSVGCCLTHCPCQSCEQLHRVQPDIPTVQQHMERLQRQNNARSIVTNVVSNKLAWLNETVPLSTLVGHARNTQSSQEKDKVYAFLGLIQPDHGITISYDKAHTIHDLFTDTARSIILCEEHGINIVKEAGTAVPNRRTTPTDDALPSWAPSWTLPEDPKHHKFLKSLKLPSRSNAGAELRGNAEFVDDNFGHPRRILVLTGIKIAQLQLVQRYHGEERWNMFATSLGTLVAKTTSMARKGDEIWILGGVKWPFILRKESSGMRVLLAPAMLTDGLDGQRSGIMFGVNTPEEWQRERLSIC